MKHSIRYATHPKDFESYNTQRIRDEFLVSNIFTPDEINLTYSMYDRYIVGGAMPLNKRLKLETIDPIKADYFLHRREMGLFNVGGSGKITIDGKEYPIQYKEAIYIGSGDKEVSFSSDNPQKPALLYINSAPAHRACTDKLVTLADAESVNLGSLETSNERTINKLLVNSVVETCQLQMGMTILKPGSVWNTMPPHVHSRRMEAYFYFEVPADQAICHFMGQPNETRPIWMKNHEAVLSPSWSIHAAAGTSNYIFIWGMAGENLDYADMDMAKISDIR